MPVVGFMFFQYAKMFQRWRK